MIEIVICVLIGIVTLFLWNFIHEMSHVLMAKIVGDVKTWTIKPYPHMHRGSFRFAGAYWMWKRLPEDKDRGWVYLAPRLPDLLAILAIPATFLLTGLAKFILLIVLAGGIIDLFVGSLGISDKTDLNKISRHFAINPWLPRVVGFVISALAIAAIVVSICPF